VTGVQTCALPIYWDNGASAWKGEWHMLHTGVDWCFEYASASLWYTGVVYSYFERRVFAPFTYSAPKSRYIYGTSRRQLIY